MTTRRPLLAVLAASALLGHGCAQLSVQTTLHRDGSWTRRDSFSQNSIMGGDPQARPGDLSQSFDLPAQRGWKVRRGGEAGAPELRASKTLRVRESLQRDVVVKSKRGRLLWNQVSVRQIRPGVWQYREVLHWSGQPPKPDDLMQRGNEDLVREFRRSLPARLATPQNAREMASTTTRAAAMLLLGPPRPLLPEMIPFTELALQQFMLRLGQEIDRALKAKFGSHISNSERYGTTRKVMLAMTRDWRRESEASFGLATKASGKGGFRKPGAAKLKGQEGEWSNVSMTFSLRVPGRILETNGEVNPYTGEIFWGLYPEAAQAGDIVLSATTQMSEP